MDCMPYFLGSGGEHVKWKQNQTSPWDRPATRPQADCVHNFRTLTTGNGTSSILLAQFVWCFADACFCSESLVLVSVGEFPGRWQAGGGKKPSSLAMTAAARWLPPPLNRCVHKMWSRDVHLCLSDVCPLMRSCFDTVLGRPCDLIINNKGQDKSRPHALQFAGYFVLKLG